MRMICDRVECKGGGLQDFQNYAKRSSRIILFPDGVQRLITLPSNDWRLIDQAFPDGVPLHLTLFEAIDDHAEPCARKHGWVQEKAIQYLFKIGILYLARKNELSPFNAANADAQHDAQYT